jgi:thymidylate synthase (FAD)
VWDQNGKHDNLSPGGYLALREKELQDLAKEIYQERLALGIAREQARKDLPLNTYTRAYWKCDLHNIFNFLRLRMAPDAQLEIRQYANAMYDIVKQVCPIACEAFEDYVLHAKTFSRMEVEILHKLIQHSHAYSLEGTPRETTYKIGWHYTDLTDREWKEFLAKLS